MQNVNILTSAKKHDLDAKFNKISSHITLLINYIERILYNDRLEELSFASIYYECYNICIIQGGKYLNEALNSTINKYVYTHSSDLSLYMEIDITLYINRMISFFNDYISKVQSIQNALW